MRTSVSPWAWALNENASIEEAARERAREAAAFAAELARPRRELERAAGAGNGNERELDREELVADAETIVAESLRVGSAAAHTSHPFHVNPLF
jgi:hypothetical protein